MFLQLSCRLVHTLASAAGFLRIGRFLLKHGGLTADRNAASEEKVTNESRVFEDFSRKNLPTDESLLTWLVVILNSKTI